MKIAAGIVEAQSGEVFRHPASTIRYLEQAPDFDGFDTVQAYAEAGLGPGDDPYRVTYLLEHLGLTGQENRRGFPVVKRAVQPLPASWRRNPTS